MMSDGGGGGGTPAAPMPKELARSRWRRVLRKFGLYHRLVTGLRARTAASRGGRGLARDELFFLVTGAVEAPLKLPSLCCAAARGLYPFPGIRSALRSTMCVLHACTRSVCRCWHECVALRLFVCGGDCMAAGSRSTTCACSMMLCVIERVCVRLCMHACACLCVCVCVCVSERAFVCDPPHTHTHTHAARTAASPRAGVASGARTCTA